MTDQSTRRWIVADVFLSASYCALAAMAPEAPFFDGDESSVLRWGVPGLARLYLPVAAAGLGAFAAWATAGDEGRARSPAIAVARMMAFAAATFVGLSMAFLAPLFMFLFFAGGLGAAWAIALLSPLLLLILDRGGPSGLYSSLALGRSAFLATTLAIALIIDSWRPSTADGASIAAALLLAAIVLAPLARWRREDWSWLHPNFDSRAAAR